jgi:hypothetical protein
MADGLSGAAAADERLAAAVLEFAGHSRTAGPAAELPDRPYDFATLQAAQAAGDRQALAGRDRPLLHLHLTDRAAGLGQLLEAVP